MLCEVRAEYDSAGAPWEVNACENLHPFLTNKFKEMQVK